MISIGNFGYVTRIVIYVCAALFVFLGSICNAKAVASEANTINYPATFFSVYNPVTALDMVLRVPGFTLDEGDERRGFGATAGNVLINGDRPSTKTDSLRDALERIPAQRVERIEINRGAVNAQQQSVIANVVLKSNDNLKTSVTWSATVERDGGRWAPRGEVSLSDALGAVGFTIGIERSDFRWRELGVEDFSSPTEPFETRNEQEKGAFKAWSGTLKTETEFANGSTLNANIQITDDRFELFDQSFRSAAGAISSDLFDQGFIQEALTIEVSGDYGLSIGDRLDAKFIVISTFENEEGVSSLAITRPDSSFENSVFSFRNKNGESIARLELQSAHWRRHNLQFSLESVYTFVDSSAAFSIDFGSGPLQIDIDGANTRVWEFRNEALVLDSWMLNDALKVDAGVAVEVSTIKQSGDLANERTFVYTKPTLGVTYDASEQTQLRVRFQREVAQLDFSEFVSATNFGDDDIDFGNPELRPERTWAFEAAIEWRFKDLGVITATGFYDRISDVQDLLPLGASFEIPGNIGDGARWGGEVEATFPLDAIQLSNAQLELSAYVQGSSVTDPVTGEKRALSLERLWNYAVNFRKDFPGQAFAIGWGLEDSAAENFFGLDEFVTIDEGLEMSVFLETTLIPFAKLRIGAGNLINKRETRRRTVFSGVRDASPIEFVEDRRRNRGRSIFLTLSGAL